MLESFLSVKLQKQPSRGVLRRRCSENMHQIYRRTSMAQCVSIKLQSNFIEIALRHGHSPVNLLHIFRTPFSHNTSERLFLRMETVTLLKRDSGRSVFLSILQNKFSQKNSIVDVRLGSKYALASDRYW